MPHMTNGTGLARTTVLLGAAAVVLSGLTATVEAAPAAARSSAADLAVPGQVRTVHYVDDEEALAFSPYGENDDIDHPGTAGLYDCGPGGKNTRLSRKACGGIDRFQHLGDRF